MPPPFYESIPSASVAAPDSSNKRKSPRAHQESAAVPPPKKKAKGPAKARLPRKPNEKKRTASAEQWCEAIVEFRKGRNQELSPKEFLDSDKSPEVFNDASTAQVNLFVRRLDSPAKGKLLALLQARAELDTNKIKELCGLNQEPPYPPVSDEMEHKLMMDFDPELVVNVRREANSDAAAAEDILEDLALQQSLEQPIRDMTCRIFQKLIQNRTDEASELYNRHAAMYEGHQDCLAELRTKILAYVDADIIPVLFPGIE